MWLVSDICLWKYDLGISAEDSKIIDPNDCVEIDLTPHHKQTVENFLFERNILKKLKRLFPTRLKVRNRSAI